MASAHPWQSVDQARRHAPSELQAGGAASVESIVAATTRNLVSLVLHDVNNSLGAVLNYTALLGLQTDPIGTTAALEQITLAARHAAVLTAGLTRCLSRWEPRRAIGSVNDTVRAVVAGFRLSAGDNISFDLDLDPTAPKVTAGAAELVVVLASLVQNALESMQSGGQVTLSTREIRATAPTRGTAARPATVEITVQDRGVGMSPDLIDQAFDLFFSTKSTATGIGLPTTRAIVQNYGGRIGISSRSSVGTTVWLTWPTSSEEIDVSVH